MRHCIYRLRRCSGDTEQIGPLDLRDIRIKINIRISIRTTKGLLHGAVAYKGKVLCIQHIKEKYAVYTAYKGKLLCTGSIKE